MGNYFITGTAGFIASRVTEFLIDDGHTVVEQTNGCHDGGQHHHGQIDP